VSNLIEIKEIGPQRALELERTGVKTISDLAKRSPKHLAEKTVISIIQISKWIIEANKLKNEQLNSLHAQEIEVNAHKISL
jgi:predicted flap endonuclease-1-like 5' DNA nuclease